MHEVSVKFSQTVWILTRILARILAAGARLLVTLCAQQCAVYSDPDRATLPSPARRPWHCRNKWGHSSPAHLALPGNALAPHRCTILSYQHIAMVGREKMMKRFFYYKLFLVGFRLNNQFSVLIRSANGLPADGKSSPRHRQQNCDWRPHLLRRAPGVLDVYIELWISIHRLSVCQLFQSLKFKDCIEHNLQLMRNDMPTNCSLVFIEGE